MMIASLGAMQNCRVVIASRAPILREQAMVPLMQVAKFERVNAYGQQRVLFGLYARRVHSCCTPLVVAFIFLGGRHLTNRRIPLS